MLGAYTTYVVQLLMPDLIEYTLLIAVPAAFIVTGLIGVCIERSVIPLWKTPGNVIGDFRYKSYFTAGSKNNFLAPKSFGCLIG